VGHWRKKEGKEGVAFELVEGTARRLSWVASATASLRGHLDDEEDLIPSASGVTLALVKFALK
jgi:hypothetical protein